MQVIFQIITFFALILWGAGLMGTIMAIAAYVDSPKWLDLIVLLVATTYPIIFGLVFYKMSWNFLFLSPKSFLAVTSIIPILCALPLLIMMKDKAQGINLRGYTIKKDAIYYNSNQIRDVDPVSFVILDDFYSKDRNHVYYYGKAIQKADPQTFEKVNNNRESSYCRDRNSVFNRGVAVNGLDVGSFQELQGGYYKTRDAVFLNAEKFLDADPKSFVVLDSTYSKDNNHVYYSGQVLPDIEAGSFEAVGGYYYRNANSVFYLDKLIAGADSRSFKYLANHYASDHEHVYYDERKIDDVEVSSFSVIDSTSFGKDKNHVFYLGHPILAMADSATFEFIKEQRDFEPVNENPAYARDRNRIYSVPISSVWNQFNPEECFEVRDADYASFAAFAVGYARDKNKVYFRDARDTQITVIEGADADSFRATDRNLDNSKDAKDNRRNYLRGRVVK